ncbi:transcription antitermination regulator [Cellulomonas pakistanensis]|uniref:Transcription antitermination regulator n=1 Tax=Cellulomonas pakistanensis TaxID=992287 RepID=A0A919PD60_9CELL|nr:transcription antitermination regulator [Cellulomonas pakistanensis]
MAQPGTPDGAARDATAGPASDAGPAAWRVGALDEIHELLVSAVPVDDLLDVIVTHAARRSGASAAITVRVGGTGAVAASSDALAEACDRAEQAAGEGPCLDASREQRRITVRDVHDEQRWPAWREATVAAGFCATAALPAARRDGVRIDLAIDLYHPEPGDWPEDVLDDVARFADDAARAVAVAAQAQEQRRTNEDLRSAIASRTVIDQALGVVMAQNRCGPEEAFDILRRASQTRNQKMRDLAAAIVASVSGQEPHSPHEFRERPRR